MELPDIVAGEPVYLGIATIVTEPTNNPGQFLIYDQSTPMATWTINHTFTRFPSVTVIDASGFVIITDVEHANATTVVLTFAQPISGKALLV